LENSDFARNSQQGRLPENLAAAENLDVINDAIADIGNYSGDSSTRLGSVQEEFSALKRSSRSRIRPALFTGVVREKISEFSDQSGDKNSVIKCPFGHLPDVLYFAGCVI